MTTDDAAPGVSIVAPLHNEADALADLLSAVEASFPDVAERWELVAVDDASTDATWQRLREARDGRPWLRGIRLARRAGQHAATMAGLEAARGEIVAAMDADMQVPAEDVAGLVRKVLSGSDVAFAARSHTREGFLRGTLGPAVLSFLAEHTVRRPRRPPSTFFAARREVVERALKIENPRPVVPFHLMLGGAGRIEWMDARESPRVHGESKYTLAALAAVALDVLFGYTDLPRRALAVCALGAPAAAAAGWLACVISQLVGWLGGAWFFALCGAFLAVSGLAVLGFLAGELSLRLLEGRGRPLYFIGETL